jgi:hypothetical protein
MTVSFLPASSKRALATVQAANLKKENTKHLYVHHNKQQRKISKQ